MTPVYNQSPFPINPAYRNNATRLASPTPARPLFGTQPRDSNTPDSEPDLEKKPKKSGLLKRLLYGLGLITAIVVLGKTLLKKIGGSVISQAVKGLSLTALLGAGGKLLQSIGSRPLLGLAGLLGELAPTAKEFLASGSGQTVLTFAKSEMVCKAIVGGALGLGSHLLPEPAFQLLKTHMTHDNVKQLLDAGVLQNLMDYLERLYQHAGKKGPEAFETYLSQHATRIGDNVAKITGLEPATIRQFLKALSPA